MKGTPVLEKQIDINSYFVDSKQQLSIPSLLGLMQDIAWEHSTSYNVGWDFLHSVNLFWALSKMRVIIYRLPVWQETVMLRTWGKPPEYVTFHRDFEMCDMQGNILMVATSAWTTLSLLNGRIERMPDEVGSRLEIPENRHAIQQTVPKIKKIEIGDAATRYLPVLPSDIDMNQHVNNTKYILWLFNSFPCEFHDQHIIKEFIINYVSQAKAGDFYAIKTEEDSPNHFRSVIYSQEEHKEICKVETFWVLK